MFAYHTFREPLCRETFKMPFWSLKVKVPSYNFKLFALNLDNKLNQIKAKVLLILEYAIFALFKDKSLDFYVVCNYNMQCKLYKIIVLLKQDVG